MSLGLQIFLKILLYSIIIIVVRGVISKIQKPAKEIATTEWGEELIDWKIFSIIYLAVAVIFAIILAFVLSYPSNLEGTRNSLSTGIFVLIILFFFLLSILYGQVYVKIGKEKISWRKMNGKECEVRYEDITSYTVDGSGNVKLYQGDKCILAFATGSNKRFVTEVLKNRKVSTKNNGNGPLILKNGKYYLVIYSIFGVASGFLCVGCTYYGIILGTLLFLTCTITFVILIISTDNNRVIIENNTIFEKKIFTKREIRFEQVDYLSLKKDNDIDIVRIHSKTGVVIKVPNSYQNFEMFEAIIAKKHWRWK